MPDDVYVPVSCDYYEELTESAIRRHVQRIRVRKTNGEYETISGVIADLFTKAGAEYMKLEDGQILRLDDAQLIRRFAITD